ncbi:hypothetical protein TP70_09200 [Staphylococcus microti]|uniref:Uncharacterized protein n=1 Tax=Staphylococcus microti TaxID=569857 RepID=A0ABR5C601_9STAP|nr:hypothetical protein TP70_09200 [Staphylococcus microti]
MEVNAKLQLLIFWETNKRCSKSRIFGRTSRFDKIWKAIFLIVSGSAQILNALFSQPLLRMAMSIDSGRDVGVIIKLSICEKTGRKS